MHAVLVWLLKLLLFLLGVAGIVLGFGIWIAGWTIAILSGIPPWGTLLAGVLLLLVGIYTVRHT